MALQLSIGARVRKSPFFQASCKAGLTAASVYNHMYMPTSYGDPVAEYHRLISDVAMWDVAVERQVALKGPDALALARLLTPRNLDGLVIGQGKYVPICWPTVCMAQYFIQYSISFPRIVSRPHALA